MNYSSKTKKQQEFNKNTYNTSTSLDQNEDFSNFPQFFPNSFSKNSTQNYPIMRQQKSDTQYYYKQLNSLRQMNKLLKEENLLLRQIIRDQENEQKQHNKIVNTQQMQQEINNFKHIIEKSYYTIKDLEKENIQLEYQLEDQRNKKESMFNQIEQLRQNNYTLSNKLRQQESEHYREINQIKNRITDLEDNIQSLLRAFEREQRQYSPRSQRHNSFDKNQYYYRALH